MGENLNSILTLFGGLALFLYGMDELSRGLEAAAGERMRTLLAALTGGPVRGVLTGLAVTAVLQSSSATIAMLQNLAAQPGPGGGSLLGLAGALPILLGDNVGTTITAILASLGRSRDAKRTAAAHAVFNLSGAAVFCGLLPQFVRLTEAVSPKGPETEVIARQIANAHTLFNLVCTLVWLPLTPVMVRFVTWLVPGASPKTERNTELHK